MPMQPRPTAPTQRSPNFLMTGVPFGSCPASRDPRGAQGRSLRPCRLLQGWVLRAVYVSVKHVEGNVVAKYSSGSASDHYALRHGATDPPATPRRVGRPRYRSARRGDRGGLARTDGPPPRRGVRAAASGGPVGGP